MILLNILMLINQQIGLHPFINPDSQCDSQHDYQMFETCFFLQILSISHAYIIILIRRMGLTSNNEQKKYNKIPLENRKMLVKLVLDEQRSISKSASKLGIKLSTAKLIIKKYKETGQFFQCKEDKLIREASELQLENNMRSDVQTQAPLSPCPSDSSMAIGYNGLKTFDCQANYYSYPQPAFYLMQACYPGNMYWF